MRSLLRRRPLHFVLIGVFLFAGEAALRVDGPRPADERPRVEVSDRRVRALAAQHARRVGFSPDPATVRELVDRFVEEEILYREALRRGLATDNPAVVVRLRQKLEFLDDEHGAGMGDEAVLREAAALGLGDEDVVLRNMFVRNMRLLLGREADRSPTEAELEEHLQRHGPEFRKRARVTWRHVLLANTSRGEPRSSAVDGLLGRLRSEELVLDRTAELGDPFAGGHVFRGTTRDQIRTRFGSEFADAVLALPEGGWSDPIASPFGLHFVWVDRHAKERIPTLEEVRDRVILSWRREQRKAHVAQTVAALRASYDVVVEEGMATEARPG